MNNLILYQEKPRKQTYHTHIFGKEISLPQIFLLVPFPSNSQQQNSCFPTIPCSSVTDISDNSSDMLEPRMPNHDDSSQAQKSFRLNSANTNSFSLLLMSETLKSLQQT